MGRVTDSLRYWKNFRHTLAAVKGYDPERDMSLHPFPSIIQVQTINACNAACVMCPYGRVPSNNIGGRMDDELWQKITDEIAEYPEARTLIPMLQNEPFLDPKILNKVREFKQKTCGRVEVELVTHGGVLTSNVIEALRDTDLDVLSISVDSIRPRVYEEIRSGLNFNRVMGNIDSLIAAKLGIRIIIRMVRQAANSGEVEEFVAFWRERGLETVVWDVSNRSGALANFADIEAPTSEATWHSQLGNFFRKRLLARCPIPFAMVSILHDGNVLACGFDWSHEVVIGNVLDSSIAEIWNSPAMRLFRLQHYQNRADEVDICRRCSIWQQTWGSQPISRGKTS